MTTPLPFSGDREIDAASLAKHLAGRPAGPAGIVASIAAAAPALAARLALDALPGDPATEAGRNHSGDREKALDLAAHEHRLAALAQADVRAAVFEEAPDAITMSEEGGFDVAIDPITVPATSSSAPRWECSSRRSRRGAPSLGARDRGRGLRLLRPVR